MDEFSQQLVNGLALGSIYALIALGYTLVYGVLRFINFAHGDVLMVGAYIAFYAAPWLQKVFGNHASLSIFLAILLLSMLGCAILGILIERLAYRPLRNQARLAVLITSIGISMLLAYGGQVVFGANQRPFPELLPSYQVDLGNHIGISSGHLVVIGVTLALLIGLHIIVRHTQYGLAIRALAENSTAAELMGVNLNATIAWAFGLGSALAGAAGVLYAMNIHSIEPLMGLLPGIKAFIAAVLGGIGNLPGAAIGGLILGLIESFAGGSAISSYRDAIAFAVLVLILLIRPAGLLGRFQPEKV